MVRLRANIIMALIVVALLYVVSFICTGCYNYKKAQVQHGRAVSSFPEIGAKYCADKYPDLDSFIAGDTTVWLDTIYVGQDHIFDTIYLSGDTVMMTRVLEKPAKVITKTIRVTDTIRWERRAALDLCAIERASAIRQLEAATLERDQYRSKARTRLWIIIGMGAGMLLALAAFFYRKKVIK